MIALLFRDYWATDAQKEIIIAKQNYDRKRIEEEKREKYNPDDIFKNKQNNVNSQNLEKQEEKLSLVEYKKYTWYQKLFSKIIKLLGKE